MKSKAIIISALSLGILAILVGCEETATTGQTGTQVNKVAPPVSAPLIQYSQADMAAFQGAMQLKDSTFCDKIKDEVYKKNCKATLQDTQANNDAQTKMDPTLCAKLSTPDFQEACKTNIEVAQKRSQQQMQANEVQTNDNQIITDANKTGDLAKCKTIKEENIANTCEANILVQKAEKAKDKSVCNQASSEVIKKFCLDSLTQ